MRLLRCSDEDSTTLNLSTTALLFLLSTCVRAADDTHHPTQSSTFCYTAPRATPATKPLTTLHESSTSTELALVDEFITYTITGPVPDYTTTYHTETTITQSHTEYREEFTATVHDGSWTETLARPTITIYVEPPPQNVLEPAPVTTTIPARERDAAEPREGEEDDVVQGDYDTVVCNTIFYTTRTGTMTSIASVVNSGTPARTLSLTITHMEVIDRFDIPPGRLSTERKKWHWTAYTSTYEIATVGQTDVPVVK